VPGCILYPEDHELMFLIQLLFAFPEGLPLLLLILMIMIWAVCLVAIANGRFYDNTTKLCWFLIVLFLNVLGVLLFLFWGKNQVDRSSNHKKSPE